MKYSLNLDTNGRILHVTEEQYLPSGVLVNTLPKGNVVEYIYQNGQYVHSPLPTEEVPPQPTLKERVQATEQALLALMGG